MTPGHQLSEPILFNPIYKKNLWGGRNLQSMLAKQIPDGIAIGESWELSGFGTESSLAVNEKLRGVSLNQLVQQYTTELLGTQTKIPAFPLLFKFIDANDKLSVQVHPTDEQAQKYGWGVCGKTECWFIIKAPADGKIIVGIKPGVTIQDVNTAIQNNTLPGLLNVQPIVDGDLLFIPAGTVHAILGGTLLYEVQQSSDTTFRLDDWGRVDANGKPRQLHRNEALQVIDTSPYGNYKIPPVIITKTPGIHHNFRVACRYFAVEEYVFENHSTITLQPKTSFIVISVLSGSINLYTGTTNIYPYSKGQTVLIPAAACHSADIVEADANSRILLTTVPDLKSEIIHYLRTMGVSDERIAQLGGNPAHNDITVLLN